MEPEEVSFQFLREITDGFSKERILGQEAFGVVYKGVNKNGEDVAVKKLKLCYDDLDYKQFRNEFYNRRKLKHQNIVQVLGYCYETEKKTYIMPDGSNVPVDEIYAALCFEYLPNGSLQKHLSDGLCELKLDWYKRFKLIKGTCEGLKYIHKDLEEPIYHLDLKPHNILLDKDMVPKIGDFGLSRIQCKEVPQNAQSRLGTPGYQQPEHIDKGDFGLSRIHGKELPQNTQSRLGTPGYQPPEHIDRGEISDKFDIFSLGVVMIQIVSGPKGSSDCQNMSSDEFVDQKRSSSLKRSTRRSSQSLSRNRKAS